MKKRVSNLKSLLLLLLLFTVAGFSISAQDAVKDFSESYDVSKGVTLSSDTRYSDVELITWDQNRVDIQAEVKVDASSKSKADEALSRIDVKIGKSGNTISVSTEFQEGWSKNAKVDIHITVKVPAYLNLTLESSYGDVFIQELTGLVLLDINYGNLKAGSLERGDEKPYNRLELSYSDATIDKAGCMELELAYSELEIGNSFMLFVQSKYSKLTGERAVQISTEGAYDKYYFDEVDNMVADLKYSGIKFGALNKRLMVESKYTNVRVDHLSRDFKEVNISSSYGSVYLDVEEGASFKLEGEARYGKINVALDGKLSKQKENTYMKTWGSIGPAPKGTMKLDVRYGNIDIL
jgi:hypothetical protein